MGLLDLALNLETELEVPSPAVLEEPPLVEAVAGDGHTDEGFGRATTKRIGVVGANSAPPGWARSTSPSQVGLRLMGRHGIRPLFEIGMAVASADGGGAASIGMAGPGSGTSAGGGGISTAGGGGGGRSGSGSSAAGGAFAATSGGGAFAATAGGCFAARMFLR